MAVSKGFIASIIAVASEFVVIVLASICSNESALDDPGKRTLVGNTRKQLEILSWSVSGLYIRELVGNN